MRWWSNYTSQKRKQGRKIIQRTILFSLALMTLLGSSLALFTPLLEQQALAASGSAVNLPARGAELDLSGGIGDDDTKTTPYGTCEAYWDKVEKSRDLLSRQFYPEMNELAYKAFDDPYQERAYLIDEYETRQVTSLIGTDFGGALLGNHDPEIERIVKMLQQMGKQQIPVIRFRSAPSSSTPLHGAYAPNTDLCNSYMMIPVGYPGPNNEPESWRGFQIFSNSRNVDTEGRYMEFKLTGNGKNSGSFTHWGKENGDTVVTRYENDTLFVQGTFPGTPTTNDPHLGKIGANWVDAATIAVGSEIYKKRKWSTHFAGFEKVPYSYYFLEKANSGRENLAWSNNPRKCEDALPLTDSCAGSGSLCVPFIAIRQQINVSLNEFGSIQGWINNLGKAQAEQYDFDTNCINKARNTVQLNQSENAKIWLYYSNSQKAFVPVFTGGDGNEIKYIGTYTETKAPNVGPSGGTSGEYKLGECAAIINANPLLPGANDMIGVSWTLTDGICSSLKNYGTINVLAKGGAAGETGFGNNQEDIQDTIDAGAGESEFVCDLGDGPLNWFLCPAAYTLIGTVEGIEALINDALEVNTDLIFKSKGDAIYNMWAGFRSLALVVLLLVALWMILSQVTGIGKGSDPYIIKKMGPLLIIAAILMPMSWGIAQFVIPFSNDLGLAVRNIILSALPPEVQLGGLAPSGLLVGLLSSGALFVFGPLGLLSFAATAALVTGIAFIILAIRELLIVACVIIAPFAIATKAIPKEFPFLDKFWSVWSTTSIALLFMFPLISGAIALGRAFAIIFLTMDGSPIVAFVIYLVGLGSVIVIARASGGAAAFLFNGLNDQARGGFDRLRNFRKQRGEDRMERFRSGELFNSDSLIFKPGRRGGLGAVGSGINNLGAKASLGARGRFGIGNRGQAAAAIKTMANSAKRAKSEDMETLANMSDASSLIMAASGGTEAGARAFVRQRVASGKWRPEDADEAFRLAQVVGFNRMNATAALQKVAETKAREVDAGDVALMESINAGLSGGNSTLATALADQAQAILRSPQGQRPDLGGILRLPNAQSAINNLTAAMAAAGPTTGFNGTPLLDPTQAGISTEEHDNRMKAINNTSKGIISLMDSIERTGVQAVVAAHGNTIKGFDTVAEQVLRRGLGDQKQKQQVATMVYEMQQALSSGTASAGNRDAIALMMSKLGLDQAALDEENAALRAAAVAAGGPGATFTPHTVTSRLAEMTGTDWVPARDIHGNLTGTTRDVTAKQIDTRARAFSAQARDADMMSGNNP